MKLNGKGVKTLESELIRKDRWDLISGGIIAEIYVVDEMVVTWKG